MGLFMQKGEVHPESMKTVAFLGLGAMGSRMAARLLDAGHAVVAYNRSPGPAEALRAKGATLASTPREALADVDVALSMLTDDGASRSVWTHPETGGLAGVKAGTVIIESSTLSPAWVRELGDTVDRAGATLVEAPVVGSTPQAEAGQLSFLCGGQGTVVDGIRPLLGTMGTAVFHVGEVGLGTVVKLAVNASLAVQVAALGELLAVVQRQGVELARAVEILGSMPTAAPALKGIAGLILAGDHAPRFPVQLVAKDLGYAAAMAAQVDTPVPTTQAVRDLYERAIQAGLGDRNLSAVAELFNQKVADATPG